MPALNKSEFILLSELIHKLEDKTYYRTYAKSLLRAYKKDTDIPTDNELVKEMFAYFINNKELEICYDGNAVTPDFIDTEIDQRASKKIEKNENLEAAKKQERKLIWDNEIYIKVKDLKKLYANKCIVFPKSFLITKRYLE